MIQSVLLDLRLFLQELTECLEAAVRIKAADHDGIVGTDGLKDVANDNVSEDLRYQ